MSTFGVMKARIADELARADITTQIERAIQSAITHHERKRFFFNEAIDTFTSAASQEWYSATDAAWIATAVQIDSLRVTISDRPYPLIKWTMDEMEEVSSGSAITGDPTNYAFYRQQIRLYPVPNAARTMTAAYVERFATMTSDTDTNAWMVEAEELIRLRAKMIIWRDVIRDMEEYATLVPFEAEALRALQQEGNRRAGSGRVVAHYL